MWILKMVFIFRVESVLLLCNISYFWFSSCKIFFLDFVLVIWSFLVLDLHEFWLYKIDDMAGGKPKFDQINRGVNRNLLKLQGVEFFMKAQNQINFKLQGRNPKKIFYTSKNQKWLILQRDKTLLTLIFNVKKVESGLIVRVQEVVDIR